MNFSVKCLKFSPKRPISFTSAYFGGKCCYHNYGKSQKIKLIPDIYTLAFSLLTNEKKMVKSNFYFFNLIGGPNSLTHEPLSGWICISLSCLWCIYIAAFFLQEYVQM